MGTPALGDRNVDVSPDNIWTPAAVAILAAVKKKKINKLNIGQFESDTELVPFTLQLISPFFKTQDYLHLFELGEVLHPATSNIVQVSA